MNEEKKWYCSDCGGKLWPTCYYCNEPMTTEDVQEIKAHLEQCEKRPPSEMQRLVEWLKCEQKYYTVNDDGSVTDYQGAYGTVLDHIRAEFLGEATE